MMNTFVEPSSIDIWTGIGGECCSLSMETLDDYCAYFASFFNLFHDISIIEEQKQQGRKKLSNPEECLKKTLQSKLEKNLLYNEEETNHFPPQMDGRKKSRFQLEVSKTSA